jgi:hypothetical protein
MRNQVRRNIERLIYYNDENICHLAIIDALKKLDKNKSVHQAIDCESDYLDFITSDVETLTKRINSDLFYLLLTTPHCSHYKWFKTLLY